MASPRKKLRSAIDTLLRNNITYTKKSGGTPNVSYFEQVPSPETHMPFLHYVNCSVDSSDAKDCNGWDAMVTIGIMAGAQPGHDSYDPADEIEEKVIALFKDRPYVLDLSPDFNIVSVEFEGSDYDKGLRNIGASKPSGRSRYIVAIESDFRIILSEA